MYLLAKSAQSLRVSFMTFAINSCYANLSTRSHRLRKAPAIFFSLPVKQGCLVCISQILYVHTRDASQYLCKAIYHRQRSGAQILPQQNTHIRNNQDWRQVQAMLGTLADESLEIAIFQTSHRWTQENDVVRVLRPCHGDRSSDGVNGHRVQCHSGCWTVRGVCG